jgi:hypothetical protein
VGHLRDAQHGFAIGTAENMVMTHLPPNKSDAANPAIASLFHSGRQ